MTRTLLLSFFVGVGVLAWAQYRFAQYETRILEAEGDARYARESEQRLLSRGRWIRDIDPKSGISTYRFARSKEQR